MDKILITPNEETVDLLPGYLERRRNEVNEIEGAVRSEDFSRLATFGHNIKGTAGSYGVPGLGELAEQLHHAAVGRNAEACRKYFNDYQDYLARLEVAEIA